MRSSGHTQQVRAGETLLDEGVAELCATHSDVRAAPAVHEDWRYPLRTTVRNEECQVPVRNKHWEQGLVKKIGALPRKYMMVRVRALRSPAAPQGVGRVLPARRRARCGRRWSAPARTSNGLSRLFLTHVGQRSRDRRDRAEQNKRIVLGGQKAAPLAELRSLGSTALTISAPADESSRLHAALQCVLQQPGADTPTGPSRVGGQLAKKETGNWIRWLACTDRTRQRRRNDAVGARP